jgi:hypothetical protein
MVQRGRGEIAEMSSSRNFTAFLGVFGEDPIGQPPPLLPENWDKGWIRCQYIRDKIYGMGN